MRFPQKTNSVEISNKINKMHIQKSYMTDTTKRRNLEDFRNEEKNHAGG